MSDDIPQDQVEAVSEAILDYLEAVYEGGFAREQYRRAAQLHATTAIRVLTPMIAAVERERCAKIAEAYRAEYPETVRNINYRLGIAESIRSVKGAVT